MRGTSQAIPEQNKALQVMSGRRYRAAWKMMWMAIGIGCACVLLYFDVAFTARGLIPIFGNNEASVYLCWALSLIMSPLELAGTQIQVERYLKKELSRDAATFLTILVIIVFVADIITNWMGMFEAAAASGVQLGALYYLIIGIAGLAIAFIEYVIDAFVMILSREAANFKEANAWMRQWEETQERGGSRAAPMGRPAATSFSPSPMRAGATRPPESSRRPQQRPPRRV